MADMEVKFQADAEQIKNAIERLRANGRINIRPITVYAFAGDVP